MDPTDAASHPYDRLTPEVVLDAVESFGVQCDGRFLALNSYENRVYQVGVEDASPLIAKFYRPGRWSDAAILEEHAFAAALAAQEIPVVAPLTNADGETLFRHEGFRFALYPRRGGRSPELDNADNLRVLGRFIGRIHLVGAAGRFEHRPALTVESFGTRELEFLLESGRIPAELVHNYRAAAEQVLEQTAAAFDAVYDLRRLRLHGDCHPGNILWTDQGPHFVDLDDALSGPAMQDLWMLLSGDRQDMQRQLIPLLEGYNEFHDFDPQELRLIEPLRALRLIRYAAWLARRWDDPAFPHHFPWFGLPRYWEEQMLTLREQCERLEAPPLELT